MTLRAIRRKWQHSQQATTSLRGFPNVLLSARARVMPMAALAEAVDGLRIAFADLQNLSDQLSLLNARLMILSRLLRERGLRRPKQLAPTSPGKHSTASVSTGSHGLRQKGGR